MLFGERIKTLREQRNITQKELAEAIGVSDVMISMYEQNKKRPSLPTIIKMAEFLDVSFDVLLGKKEITLSESYLSLAKEAEKNGIDPEDIRTAIETIKKYKGGN